MPISVVFNGGLLVVTEAELIKQVLLAQGLLSINVAGPALSLLVLLLVSHQQLLDLFVDHLFSLGLFLFCGFVVEQSCRFNAEVRPITLQLLEEGDV